MKDNESWNSETDFDHFWRSFSKDYGDELLDIVNLGVKDLDEIRNAVSQKMNRIRLINDTDHDLNSTLTSLMIITLIWWYLDGVSFCEFWKSVFFNLLLIWEVIFREKMRFSEALRFLLKNPYEIDLYLYVFNWISQKYCSNL